MPDEKTTALALSAPIQVEIATLLCPDCEQTMIWAKDIKAGERSNLATSVTCPTVGCAGNVTGLRAPGDVARIVTAIRDHLRRIQRLKESAS